MKILLLGKNGQLGWELQRALSPVGDLLALSRINESGTVGDLCNLQGLRETCRKVEPNVIVNAAAYTAVDAAESERELAMLVNGEAQRVLAEEAARIGALLVHYSTDYVFDGSGDKPWEEDDAPAPLNFYGESKLAGERAIVEAGCKFTIFRTSWVYGKMGSNFAKKILMLAKREESLRVVNDQFGVPTGADLIADVTAHALRRHLSSELASGVYHLAPRGETNWFEYANLLFDEARQLGVELSLVSVDPVSSNDYSMRARRPINSRLNSSKLERCFGLKMPGWKIGVQRLVRELVESRSCMA